MPFRDQTNTNTIVIGENRYTVHELSDAQRTTYWEWIEGLAKLHLNPWDDLYQKVKDLPLRLQEIIFVGSRKSLFPLTVQEKTGICCTLSAIKELADLSLDACIGCSVEAIELGMRVDKALKNMSRAEVLQVYIDLIGLLGDSYTGKVKPAEPEQRLSGQDAIDFLRGRKAESAEVSAAGEHRRSNLPSEGLLRAASSLADEAVAKRKQARDRAKET